MFEFFSEFTDRTESSRLSIGVRSSAISRGESGAAPSVPRDAGAEACEPKPAKYWKCVCASAAA